MSDEKLTNPFPTGGIAEPDSYYFPYWESTAKDYKEYIEELSINKSQFMVISGPWGSGKSATLYYIEGEIAKKYPKALIFHWNLSAKPPDKTFVQAFYTDYLSELKSFVLEKKIPIKFAATDFKMEYKFLDTLDDDQNFKLHHLLETYQGYKDNIEDTDEKLKESITKAWQDVRDYIKTIVPSVEVNQKQVNEIGNIILKSWPDLFAVNINLQDKEIVDQMKIQLQRVSAHFEFIVLLIDEFDILIRDIIKEEYLEDLRRFILLIDKGDFKGYHFIGAFHDENIPRLHIDHKNDPMGNIFRRLHQCRINLFPPKTFDDFYNNIYKNSLYEKGHINRKFDLFDKRFVHFLYKLCKDNFGLGFKELHSKFNLWEDKILESYEKFKKLESTSKIEKFTSEISRYDLNWDEQNGIYKEFSQDFMSAINKDEINIENRKLIINKLISSDSIEDSAFSYQQIADDLGFNNKKIVSDFHIELLSEKNLSTVFPKYEDRFYISYPNLFKIFNFSRTSQPRQVTDAVDNYETKKETNFASFIRFFTVTSNLNLRK